jgi:hypothetical protein
MLKHEEPLSNFAFNFKLRRYALGDLPEYTHTTQADFDSGAPSGTLRAVPVVTGRDSWIVLATS